MPSTRPRSWRPPAPTARTARPRARSASRNRWSADMAAADVEARRRGRPRSVEADDAILTAAFAVFAECGFDGMTVEGVAARAGVGKGTIYRRYPNKLDLVIAASTYFAQEREPSPDTGTIAGDLRVLIDRLIAVFTNSPVGTALPMMIAERKRLPELAAAHDDITARKRE